LNYLSRVLLFTALSTAILFSEDIESLLKMQSQIEEFQKRELLPQKPTTDVSKTEVENILEESSRVEQNITEESAVEEGVDSIFKYDSKESRKEPKKSEVETLSRYGDNFFDNRNLKNGFLYRVPDSYRVNIGDKLSIWIYGAKSEQLYSTVDRNGNIKVEGLEPINIYSLKFSQVQKFIEERLQRVYPHSKVYVDLDKTNSIQILVTGDVNAPGLYNVPALSTLQEVLIATNGVSKSGSYRDIRVIRKGRVVKRFDIYKILRGGKSNQLNYSLRNGDTVSVSRVKSRISIYGEINRPAIYELLPKENFTTLLKFSGGLKASADSHRIELTRFYKNREVRTYDLSLDHNYRLKDGDQIKIYPIPESSRREIYLFGNISRAGKREFLEGDTLHSLFNRELTDGLQSLFLKGTDLDYSVIKRVNKRNLLEEIVSFSLKDVLAKKGDIKLQNLDKIYIFSVDSFRDRPYIYTYGDPIFDGEKKYNHYPKMVLKDLFSFVKFRSEVYIDSDGKECVKDENLSKYVTVSSLSLDELEADADECHREYLKIDNKVKVSRRVGDKNRVFILDRERDSNFKIEPYDEVRFFKQNQEYLRKYVTIRGEVIKAGRYEIDGDTTLPQLIEMTGGFTKRAYLKKFEIVRFNVIDGRERVHRVINDISLQEAMDSHYKLEEFDEITILKIPNWSDTKVVEIDGEVRFPGKYVLNDGEKLSALIERAGGFKESAFLDGSIFTREDVKAIQKKRIDESVSKLRRNLLYLSSSATSIGESNEDKQRLSVITEQLIKDMENFKPNGRVSIYIDRDIDKFRKSLYNIELEDGDKLFIPTVVSTVTVVGEVLNPNSFIHTSDNSVDSYLERAGGITEKASEDNIYIVKANGEAIRYEPGFFFGSSVSVEKGDSIIVPMNISTDSNIKIAKDITQILYQLAVTTASLSAVGLF
jgi:protein involved in polysaccharide export with SLBB domain